MPEQLTGMPKQIINIWKIIIKTFLPESKKVNKEEKLICSIENKEKYVIHIRSWKQALINALKLKKVHRIIQFKQKSMVKGIYWHKHWIKKKCKEWIWKRFL